MRIHFVTASFNRINNKPLVVKSSEHIVSIANYDDSNTATRTLAMHPRLKGKIPKMLEWKNVEADWYVWLDDSLSIVSDDIVSDILKCAGKNKICLFRHPDRNSIKEEYSFMEKLMKKGNLYLYSRYKGEPIKEQVHHYLKDKNFKDHSLFWMGFFAYHKSMRGLMEEWFMENILWSIQDQISFPYILHKYKIKYSIFNGTLKNNPYVIHKISENKNLLDKLIYQLKNFYLAVKSLIAR